MAMHEIWKRVRRILWEDSFDVVELFGSINAFGWGLWLIFHPGLFQNETSVYEVLSKFGNEYFWGWLLFALGVARLVGLVLDRFRMRKGTAMFATVLWAFICVGFYQQNPSAIIVFITAENTILSAWEYLRHSRHARIRKEVRDEISSDRVHI